MSTGRWQNDVVERARAALPAHVFRFFAAGAHHEVTASEAERAWSAVRFRPHVLRDVRDVDLTTTLLGTECADPVGLAPPRCSASPTPTASSPRPARPPPPAR